MWLSKWDTAQCLNSLQRFGKLLASCLLSLSLLMARSWSNMSENISRWERTSFTEETLLETIPKKMRYVAVWIQKHFKSNGEVGEWLKPHASKACLPEMVTWVQIPPSPPLRQMTLRNINVSEGLSFVGFIFHRFGALLGPTIEFLDFIGSTCSRVFRPSVAELLRPVYPWLSHIFQ